VPVHPGVYVDHTGPLTWKQRSWAAVLYAWPAALSHRSALRDGDGPGRRDSSEAPVHLAIGRDRHVADVPGVVLHRTAGFEERVQWNLGPPRVRYDEAVLDVAASAPNELDAISELARACGARRTTAARLVDRLDQRERIAGRRWLRDVLVDVAQGTCSVLEHGYLTRVERPHGLLPGRRQALHVGAGGSTYRDVEYAGLRLIVELDGRLFHSSVEKRDDDLERDLDAAVERAGSTVRLGYGQVFARGCRTAVKVGAVMNRLGWDGEVTPCPQCGGSDEPGSSDPPHSRP
jgi:hypothetical protein